MTLSHYINIILLQTVANLRTEAVRTHLSVLWWVIEPILYMLTFYIVFGLIFERGGEGYIAVLLIGLVVWRWFDSTVRNSTTIVSQHLSLMHQVYLPKYIFPSVLILVNTVKAMLIVLLLIGFLLLYGVTPSETWVALPIMILIQFLFIACMTMLLASLAPFLPDLQVIVTNLLTFMFFMSGVFFDLSSIPEEYVPALKLNPMLNIIDSYRSILLNNEWPDWGILSLILLFSLAGIAVAIAIFNRYDYLYPKLVSK